MGSKLGPSYACLFMGHQETFIMQQYTGPKPNLYIRYIDDIFCTSSLSNDDLNNFFDFCNDFHPSIKFTHSVIFTNIPFLDLNVKINNTSLITTIHYKPTDSHNYLKYNSNHPESCKNSVPYIF